MNSPVQAYRKKNAGGQGSGRHYSRFLRKWRSGTNLPDAADGSVAPLHPSPGPRVLIPTVRAWQHLYTALRLRSPGLPLRAELSWARVKQAFMKIKGKTMTLCRSRGETKMQRAKGKALSVNQQMLLKGSLLPAPSAMQKGTDPYCLALEGLPLERPHA